MDAFNRWLAVGAGWFGRTREELPWGYGTFVLISEILVLYVRSRRPMFRSRQLD
jgi:hypothetical protein